MKEKIFSTLGGIVGFLGFFMMVGAVGSSDLATEMGVWEPWYAHMGLMVVGLLVMIIGLFIASIFDDEEDTEDYDYDEY